MTALSEDSTIDELCAEGCDLYDKWVLGDGELAGRAMAIADTIIHHVPEMLAERDRAREAVIGLEQQLAVRDVALAEMRAIVDEWHDLAQSANSPERYDIGWVNAKLACAIYASRILTALDARIEAQLFPTDEEGASDE